jgi:hypothetical protein
MTPREFEQIAKGAMERHYGCRFHVGRKGEHAKRFDYVSEDGSVLGDAKYYTLVHRRSLPPAEYATIVEHVWLLEKMPLPVARCFLVFGNQIEVPTMWLDRYGHLATIDFLFVADDGSMRVLQAAT